VPTASNSTARRLAAGTGKVLRFLFWPFDGVPTYRLWRYGITLAAVLLLLGLLFLGLVPRIAEDPGHGRKRWPLDNLQLADPAAVKELDQVPSGLVLLLGSQGGGHEGAVRGVALSRDGRYVLTGGADKTLRLWDLAGDPPGRAVRSFEGNPGVVESTVFSPDGSRALSTSSEGTCLWDVNSGKELHRLKASDVGLAFAPGTGAPFAAGADAGQLWLRDMVGGKEMYRFDVPANHGWCAAFAPLANRIAIGSRDKGDVFLWHVEIPKARAKFSPSGMPSSVTCMSFSLSGGHLLWGCADGSVRAWEVDSAAAKPPMALAGHSRRVSAVAISPDAMRIAAADDDGRVIVWDAVTGKRWQDWKLPSPVHGLAFDDKTRHLATANGNGTVFIFRLRRETGQSQP
jgi:WD40 repeat protein